MTETLEIEKENLAPDWANAPTVSDLKQNIDDAEVDQGIHQQDVDRWLDNMAIEGKAKPAKVPGRSSVAPKVIRKHAEWRYASLSNPFLSTPDVFNVYPTTAGDAKRAKQNALVLNHQFNTYIDKVDFFDAFVREAVDTGTVLVEVSWVTHQEEVEEEEPVYEFIPSQDPGLAQRYLYLLQIKQTSQDLYWEHMNEGMDQAIMTFVKTGILYEARQTGTQTVLRVKETANFPALEVCEMSNIFIDPTCNGDLKKARFIGKKHKASLSELKRDGRYKNLNHILIEEADPLGSSDFKDSDDITSFSFKDEPRKEFVVTTYWGSWDIHDTGVAVPIVASWVGRVMIRLEENPFPFKRPPFAKSVYMPKRKSVYGEPDGELLEENQQIIGAVTRGMIDLLGRSANSQTGVRQGFVNATNMRKLKRGDDYVYNGQGDPSHSVYQHTYPEIPQSAYNMVAMQNADAESLSGVKAFGSGINSKALGDSVGGGRDAMDAASKREAGILLRLAQGVKEIGRMIVAMNAVFLSEEEVVRITDEEFVTVRRDDLAGKFDIALAISTAEEDNKKAEELAFLLQTTGPNGDPVEIRMIRAELARLRKMPEFAKRIEEYEPKPDPLAVAKAQKEVELLDAQIAKERALEAKHLTEAQANGARGYKDATQGHLNESKAGTEVAKSRDLHSSADNRNLDYLAKHTGLDHQQELDKLDRNAEHNLTATLVKAEADKQNKSETKKD